MERLFQLLRPAFARLRSHPYLVVFIAVVVSAIALALAMRLSIETDLATLLPPEYPSVQALEHLQETVGAESEVSVIIESDSFEANRQFAEDFIPRALALQSEVDGEPYVVRAEYRKEVDFVEGNALYFATDGELDQLEDYLDEEIENARLEANPFYFDLDEEEDGEETEAELDLQKTFDEIMPKQYPISDDSLTMVVRFYPSGAQTDVGFVERLYGKFGLLVDEMAPSTYDSSMQVSLGGRLLRNYTEIRAVIRDVRGSFIGGVTTVLLVVMLYLFWKSGQSQRVNERRRFSLFRLFQMPAATLLIALPLGMSLTWTFATAYLAFGTLNLMTSTLILVLFGLGIDYGIHFFARYAEERSSGLSVDQALDDAFVFSGPPITVSALTTAISLYVLMFADFRGFSQFGFIAGTGILFALLAMLVVLPVMIRLFTSLGLLRIEHMEQQAIPWAARKGWKFPRYKTILALSIVAAIVSALLVPGLRFEYRFGELEPEFEEYQALRAKEGRVYSSGKRNPAYIVVDQEDHIHEVSQILESRRAADSLSPTIRSIESLQNRFPTEPVAQARRLERLATVRTLLDDPFLNAADSEDLERVKKAAQTRTPIPLDAVPDHLKNQFASRDGDFGKFLLVYPSVGLSDGRRSMEFGEDIGTIALEDGTVYHATSTSIVASDMLRLLLQESPWMVAATFLMVILLMFLVFGSLRWAILALVPLAVGFLLMTAFMDIFAVRLNFYNLVVLPAVLGIGNDCGVHLVYRYREEGPGGLFTTLRSAGEHVTIGLLTTMIGFAWWMFSYHPGLNSIGVLAVIGLGCVLVAALVIFPAIIQWREDARERKAPRDRQSDPDEAMIDPAT